jgi:hypothetical protein
VVKCPFYQDWQRDPQRIRCEGVSSGNTVQLTFRGNRKWEYIKRNCCQRYQNCLIYQMLQKKYAKEKAEGD